MTRLAAAAFLMASLVARADDLAQSVVERLASYPLVRAEFRQERTMGALVKPIVSTGHMVLSREHGLIWQVEAPVKATIVFAVDPAGGGNAEAGAQAEMARLVRSIMTGDLRELRLTFELEASGDIERWRIRLKPRAREVGQYLQSIELSGGRYLEAIGIDEAGGDRMMLRMRNFTVAPALDADERRRLFAP